MIHGPIIAGKNRVYEWVAPIDYGSVVFHGAGLFPNAGTFYHDASARKIPATIFDPVNTKWEGQALRFDGVDTRNVRVGAAINSHVGPLLQMTVAAWFHSSKGAGTFRRISDGMSQGKWQLGLTTSDGLWSYWRCNSDGSGVNRGTSTAASVWTADTWQHAAMTYDGTTHTFYANAISVYSTAHNLPLWQPTSGGMTIGSNFAHQQGFNGLIRDVLVYAAALSPPQIAWLANRANNPWQPWRRKYYVIKPTYKIGRLLLRRV